MYRKEKEVPQKLMTLPVARGFANIYGISLGTIKDEHKDVIQRLRQCPEKCVDLGKCRLNYTDMNAMHQQEWLEQEQIDQLQDFHEKTADDCKGKVWSGRVAAVLQISCNCDPVLLTQVDDSELEEVGISA